MDVRLSKKQIESFCGDVRPLQLLGVTELGMEEITWELEGDCLDMRTFTNPHINGYDDGDFTDGVLLTFLSPGEANVICTYQGKKYTCHVICREMKRASSSDDLEYFIGDMHVHTSDGCSKPNHRLILTTRSDGSSPARTIADFRDDGKMDCHVITDHASMLNRREFFRGFIDAEESGENLITFAGSESSVDSVERDRFGQLCLNSNEVVCINAANYSVANSYWEFLNALNNSPYAICTYAHPHCISYNTRTWGEPQFFKNCNARFRQVLKYIEIGDGTDRSGNLVNEYVYSLALDSGFHVSTTCSSDNHGPKWGYDSFPGKTIIMAKEKSKEAFLDALLANRAYASMSGNVKVRYSVNGHTAPATLPLKSNYSFNVQISYFENIPSTKIIKGEVISNGGIAIKELEGDFSNMTFDIQSDTASWFYLRLWDEEGRKTWSVPVFTGREPFIVNNDDLVPLSKCGVTVTEENTGEGASMLVCDDPYRGWTSKGQTASLLIDLKKEQNICALGHYGKVLLGAMMKETGLTPQHFLASRPYRYAISTSIDGESYTMRAKGVFRMIHGEEIIRFDAHNARYIRLEILSTTGQNSQRNKYFDVPLSMGELTLYHGMKVADIRAQYADRLAKFGNNLL